MAAGVSGVPVLEECDVGVPLPDVGGVHAMLFWRLGIVELGIE